MKKNVIVFYTDQQRADSLGCMGNSFARTPNIDALARKGMLFTNHYSTNPVCMPSRASFITGRYPQAHRLIDNGIFLPEDELTIPGIFRQNGYRTACFGKLHFQPYKPYEGDTSIESMQRWSKGEFDDWHGPYYGFEQVELTIAHGEGCLGTYGRWRNKNFPDLELGAKHALGETNFPRFQSYKSNLPLEAHPSTWVAERAIEFLENRGEKPFYIHISFPDPHHPFTPPAPYHSMFDDVVFPPAHAVEGENMTKPKPYRDAMEGTPFPSDGGARFFSEFTKKVFQQVIAHTYGMLCLIDDCIGRVMAKLEEKGLAQDTIIVFTSDHGDFLGDHHFLFKGQLPCRSLLQVPLIIADPEAGAGTIDETCSNVDVMPTLLNLCSIDIPDKVQGVVLPRPGEEPLRDHAFESGWSKTSCEYHHYTLYKNNVRISVFPNLHDGELYDLKNDPHEHRNLFHNSDWHRIRQDLLEELLYAVGRAEPKTPPVLTDW